MTNKEHVCNFSLKDENMSYEIRDKIDKMLDNVDIVNYGAAIGCIEYVEEGDFWVAHCDEYVSIIKYCPFCGEKL